MSAPQPLPGKQLNPGIAETVHWLNERDFQTCDSGDGKTHDYGCDRPHAYVVMVVDPRELIGEARRLRLELAKVGIEVGSLNDRGEPSIEATYDPGDDTALLDLCFVDDELLAKAGGR